MNKCLVFIRKCQCKSQLLFERNVVLTYQIIYPQFSASTSQYHLESINCFYQEETKELIEYCKTTLYASASRLFLSAPYEVFSDTVIAYHQKNIASIYTDTYQYTGGAHGNTLRTSQTWDLCTGRQYRLEEFFPHIKDYKSYIMEQLQSQVSQQIKTGKSPYFEDVKELMVQNFNENNFYLSCGHIIIFYQKYDIAPYVEGIIEFKIPIRF